MYPILNLWYFQLVFTFSRNSTAYFGITMWKTKAAWKEKIEVKEFVKQLLGK